MMMNKKKTEINTSMKEDNLIGDEWLNDVHSLECVCVCWSMWFLFFGSSIDLCQIYKHTHTHRHRKWMNKSSKVSSIFFYALVSFWMDHWMDEWMDGWLEKSFMRRSRGIKRLNVLQYSYSISCCCCWYSQYD